MINYLESEIPRLNQECNTSKDQAQVDSEARKYADANLKQLDIDADAAQVQVGKLEQQKIELSSRASFSG